MKKILLRLTAGLLVLSAVYLVGANLLLSLPQTSDFVNRLKPDQFSVSWERARTWYPLRVALHGAHANGQTRKEQWQVDARRAEASLSLLAVLQGRIDVYDIEIQDLDLRLRPLLQAGAEDSAARAFFPVISNRDPDAPARQKRKPKKTFLITLEDLRLHGDHRFWVAAARGEASGSLSGNFTMNTDGGRIALDGGTIDLAVGPLSLLGVEETSSGALIEGTLTIPTMYASDLTKADGIRRVDVNARIDLPVDTLDFIGPLVGGLGKASITGKGRVRGRLHQRDGALQADTDLRVEAAELGLRLPPYVFDGDGFVRLHGNPTDRERAALDLRFGNVNGYLHPAGQERPVTLFSGRDLEASLQSESNGADADALSLKIRIPEVSVPDMAVYDALIPAQTGFELLGGQGSLAATVALRRDAFDVALDLSSAAAQVRHDALQGRTNLLFKLRARAQRDAGASLDVSGTSLRLDDTRLSRDGTTTADAAPWSVGLDIATGSLTVPVADRDDDEDALASLREAIAEGGVGALLDDASGELQATLQVSSLDWIAALLGRPLGMTLDGSGRIDAHLLVENGQAASGTRLVVQPEALSLGIMEHLVAGKGRATLSVEPQNGAPLLRALVALSDATMRRIGEGQASIEQVAFEADIRASQAIDGERETALVDLKIPSARVTDMSVFNAYLPENAPVVITSGEADLVGELHTEPGKVEGDLVLTADGIGVQLDDVDLSGDLRLTGLIAGGDPETLRFEVTGSSLLFDNFAVSGASASHDGSGWGARVQLDESELVWSKPIALSTRATMTVTDTRPFIAMMENARGEHGWIDELLTLSDLAGSLRLTMDGQGAVIHDAFLGSDKASISARGLSRADHREALLLVRYKRLSGALAMKDGKSRFSILGARERFAGYLPGKTELPERGVKIADKNKRDDAETGKGREEQRKPSPRQDAVTPKTEAANPFLDGDL